ncbi:type II toxin-antitoxin system VapC family toxin [Candidatus Woesearchaeota archaeon]|nr:type II toxin-antitoxin system VapC family toxin [Candidatus Woesearchaeota archaeon]
MSYLVDTDILIDVSKGSQRAVEFLDGLENSRISIISAMELIVGARNKKEIGTIEEFLSNYERLLINEEIAIRALELIKQHSLSDGLSIPDAFIAATAINKNLTLTTKNIKHFKVIKDIKLKVPSY